MRHFVVFMRKDRAEIVTRKFYKLNGGKPYEQKIDVCSSKFSIEHSFVDILKAYIRYMS